MVACVFILTIYIGKSVKTKINILVRVNIAPNRTYYINLLCESTLDAYISRRLSITGILT